MQKGNINDPLLRQVLPLQDELKETNGYDRDPLQETQFNPIPGLLHKYHSRVLLTFTGTCGVNCRFCFRRHFSYEENNPGTAGWNRALDYIAQDQSIVEVILSGGDPLVATDQALEAITKKLAAIPHLKRLRIHSRMPIVLPLRVTSELISAVTAPSLKTILILHCNHPNEISPDVRTAMHRLTEAGVVLLNQSVLLRGINDDVETLVALSEALFEINVQPYYLHVLDKVQGAAHFDLEIEKSRALHMALTKRLSGYLVPKLVCEQPGAPAKLSLEAREFCTE
jgi:EF-P beta-lysylation protein EpmB